jgi:hypothetical protein
MASSSTQPAAPVHLTEEELCNTTPNQRVIVLLPDHERNKFGHSFQIFCDNDEHNPTKAAIPVTVYNEAWHQVQLKKGKPATLGLALPSVHNFDYIPYPKEGQVQLGRSGNDSNDDLNNEEQKSLDKQIRHSPVRISPPSEQPPPLLPPPPQQNPKPDSLQPFAKHKTPPEEEEAALEEGVVEVAEEVEEEHHHLNPPQP